MITAKKAMKHCCKHSECHMCFKAVSWENHQFFPLIKQFFISGDSSLQGRIRVFINNMNEYVIRRLCHDSGSLLWASDPIGTGLIPGQCLYD
jgi:hypothetical protein